MEEKQSKGTVKFVSAEETADVSKVWDTKLEAGKRKLEIHLSTEVSEERYNEIWIKLLAFIAAVPLSANERLSLIGSEPIDNPKFDEVFVPLKTAEERIKTILDNFEDDASAMRITFQATTLSERPQPDASVSEFPNATQDHP